MRPLRDTEEMRMDMVGPLMDTVEGHQVSEDFLHYTYINCEDGTRRHGSRQLALWPEALVS
jgi:hypothetical protein